MVERGKCLFRMSDRLQSYCLAVGLLVVFALCLVAADAVPTWGRYFPYPYPPPMYRPVYLPWYQGIYPYPGNPWMPQYQQRINSLELQAPGAVPVNDAPAAAPTSQGPGSTPDAATSTPEGNPPPQTTFDGSAFAAPSVNR